MISFICIFPANCKFGIRMGRVVLDSKALTKVQSAVLIAIVVIAAVGGGVGYVLWRASLPPPEDIRIGVCGDLDMGAGKSTFRGVTLAAEQLNAEGGILGRNITVVAEDDDSESPPYDVAVASNALTKLVTVDKVDFIIATGGLSSTIGFSEQEICADHNKIMFTTVVAIDEWTQRVLDDYDRYKYTFRVVPTNASTTSSGMLGGIITLGEYTGFTKVAFLFQDFTTAKTAAANLNKTLPENGFQIVYSSLISREVTDFTSYFAAAEASGAEIIVPFIAGGVGSAFVKEWHNRQSPTVVWGVLTAAGDIDFWNLTEGKCDTVSFGGSPVVAGYPLTNKTVPTRDAYIQRWGEVPSLTGVGAYDALRFILPDAIRRAGTIETEAVVKALEKTNVETSSARHFVFTSSHDVMVGLGTVNSPAADYMVVLEFQWQNGAQVPVSPEAVMLETGATYKYPLWEGPWSK